MLKLVDCWGFLLWVTGKELSLLSTSILLVQSGSISTSLLVPLSVTLEHTGTFTQAVKMLVLLKANCVHTSAQNPDCTVKEA